MSELTVDQAVLGHRYRLERLLGVGSTGPVWLAEDLELRVPRALKFLSELAPDELEDLKAETLRCQELTHQGIVRIYDFVRDDDHAAICMEAIDGPDLRAAQRERTPPCFHPDEITFWMEGLCRALHHAHTFAKIIHRDLKPSNLLINRQGHLKVADFGIAKAIPKRVVVREEHTQIAGTLEYVSPQQLEGAAPSVADDIYSFGATLFELLAGRPPFVGDNVYNEVLQREPPSVAETRHALDDELPTVSKDWENAIAACLSKRVEDRPESIREVADLLGLELRQMTIREPVLPDGFLEADSTIVEMPGMQDRRVRTLQDIPLGGDSSRPRWPWIAGAGGVATLLGLAFCVPKDIEETEAPLAVTAAPARVEPATLIEDVVIQEEEIEIDLTRLNAAVRGRDWDTVRGELDGHLANGHAQNVSVLMARVRLHLASNEVPMALEDLRRLLEIEPTHAEATRLKAVAHAALEEWQAVRHAASWAIAQSENAASVSELRVLRGRASLKLGHVEDATKDFSLAVREKPNDAETHYQRGLAYREEGYLRNAIHDLTTAIQHDPQHVQARIARSRLLMQDGQFERSVKTILEDLSYVIKADPEDIEARLDRLRCYNYMQQWEGVVEDADALLKREPKWKEVREFRLIARIRTGNLEKVSMSDMELYAERFKDDVDHWYRLAGKYLAAGKFTDARDAFAEIISRDPEYYEARQGRAFAYYSIAMELAKAKKEAKLRHTQRYLGIVDINIFLSRASEKATADTYLLKTKLLFYRGDYAEARNTALEGRRLFSSSKQRFDWWIDEIKVASGLEKDRTARGRPDQPNWFERFFKRNRKS